MKKIFLLITLGFAQATIGQMNPTWLRYPAISPDGNTIVFTYKGDIYRVPATGGEAIPLTINEAQDFMPVWSSDGKSIAFASDRYGNFDVFVMPATGGDAKRLTYHSADEFPYDFHNNNAVVFGCSRLDAAENRQYPTGSMPELYEVSLNGGRVSQLLTTPAEDVKFSADGKLMVYHDKKGGENPWRKHHTSAIARDIWMYDLQSGKHTKVTDFAGEDRNPILADNDQDIYYLSEASGSFNVFKTALKGGTPQQVTNFKMHPVRFLSRTDNGVLCFSYDGQLYTQQQGSEPQKINITINTGDRYANFKNLPFSSGISGAKLSPNGKEIAFVFRGEVFVTAVDGAVTKRVTNTPQRESDISWSPDGRKLVYAGERNAKWQVYQSEIVRKEEAYFYASTLLKETTLVSGELSAITPHLSPDGKELAYIEDFKTLKVLNLAGKQTRTVVSENEWFNWADNGHDFDWSPDSKWLLVTYSEPGIGNSEIALVPADGKSKMKNITQNGFDDFEAKWMMGGKMMLYFSNRDGLRSFANSGQRQADVYGMFFTKQAWDKYRLSKEEAALAKEMDEKAAKADTTKKKTKEDSTVMVDWDGLQYRKARLSIHSASMSDAVISKDGETLYYMASFEKGLNLWTTNLRTKETKMLVPLNANGGSLQWDKEQKTLFLLADGSLSKIDPASGKVDRITISGEMQLDVAAERAYMLDHVWRRTKDIFYSAGYHGAPWMQLKTEYEKYLPSIGNNFEFSEMLSEMLGELNVSHCWSSYNSNNPMGDATASLGIFYDYNYKGTGVKITEVIREGPLDKAGFNLKAGDIILAVDGDTLTTAVDLPQLLNRKAGKNVLLTVKAGEAQKEITVKPVTLADERGLLYKRWVRRNEAEVDSMSKGQLGYVHVPGMNDAAYRTALEDAMGKYGGRKALVVDTRNNGGGDLVSDLAMWLTGKSYMVNSNDKQIASYEPTFRWNKPSISLANEANYSDGHCYAFGYQYLKIGKLVGMPVPGTCTFAGWEMLQDPSLRWGVPPVGVKMMDGKYLENHQTEPDIKVMNEYDKVSKGKDQQLEAAIAELMK